MPQTDYAPLAFYEDPMESGADYLRIRADIIYALACGMTAEQLRLLFLECIDDDDFHRRIADVALGLNDATE